MTADAYTPGQPPLLHDPDELWDAHFRHRLAVWRQNSLERPAWHIPMLEHLGMTAPEYMVWLQTGRVPDRVRRADARDGMGR